LAQGSGRHSIRAPQSGAHWARPARARPPRLGEALARPQIRRVPGPAARALAGWRAGRSAARQAAPAGLRGPVLQRRHHVRCLCATAHCLNRHAAVHWAGAAPESVLIQCHQHQEMASMQMNPVHPKNFRMWFARSICRLGPAKRLAHHEARHTLAGRAAAGSAARAAPPQASRAGRAWPPALPARRHLAAALRASLHARGSSQPHVPLH